MASDIVASGDESDEEDDDFSSSDDEDDYSWIGWFCSRKGHEFLCTVCESIQNRHVMTAAVAGQHIDPILLSGRSRIHRRQFQSVWTSSSSSTL